MRRTHDWWMGLLALSAAACSDGGAAAGPAPVLDGSYTLQGDEIEQLRGVQIATGDLQLTQVKSLDALAQLVEVHGNLSIGASEELSSLQGLEALRRVAGRLTLAGLPKLASLEGLATLEAVDGDVLLQRLDALEDLRGLSALHRIGGDLRLDGNRGLLRLARLDGTIGFPSVGGDFEVSYNQRLTEIDFGESSLDGPDVQGKVWIHDNPALRVIGNAGRTAPRTGMCGGLTWDYWIDDNDALERLALDTQFSTGACIWVLDNPALHSVELVSGWSLGELDLSNLPKLETLSLLHSATTIHSLSISNTGLTSLAGIDARVQCTLQLSQNPALSDLGEYATNPGPVANSVSISGNPLLPECRVSAMLNGLREADFSCVQPGSATVPRARQVYSADNDTAAGCENPG